MDLKIIETGNGGDLVLSNDDIQMTAEIYNQPYLAHFGGNVEGIATDYPEGTERGDWWANSFLQQNEALESTFEKTINITEISSSGRIKMAAAAAKDLEYLEGIAEVTTEVIIEGVDRIHLKEHIQETTTNNQFSYLWKEAKDEIIE